MAINGSFLVVRSTISKVYPAMYIENVTELAFDDITPEDPDFSSIQGESWCYNLVFKQHSFLLEISFYYIMSNHYDVLGLAEAGLIESRLSRSDTQMFDDEGQSPFCFSPERYALTNLDV